MKILLFSILITALFLLSSAFIFQNTSNIKCYNKAKAEPTLISKIEGMLIGSAIGDAAGGPVEFVTPIIRSYWCTTDKQLTNEGVEELASLFKLRDYNKNVEPFAQWEAFGPAGTITDDTRFKIITFNCLDNYNGNLTAGNFAASIIDFRNTLSEKYQSNYDEWIPEIKFAASWMLSESSQGYPPSRIWGGIPTMMGQMPFLPVAALNPYDPEWCYKKTYELGFFDNGIAKDINSAIVAGLACALQPNCSWVEVESTMQTTDPYNYNNIPYVDRKLTYWLETANKLVKMSNGNIARLFDLLEENLATQYWWEAWVPLVVVFSCAEIVGHHPLAAMQLMLEFGHDTDSYAQVMGAFMGALHGVSIFPENIRNTVNARMKAQYGQNVDDWMNLIQKYGKLTNH